MTIEITRPELEAIIQQQLLSGAYLNAEDVIFHALQAKGAEAISAKANLGQDLQSKTLDELLAPVRGLFADGELDFRRTPSTSRITDFA